MMRKLISFKITDFIFLVVLTLPFLVIIQSTGDMTVYFKYNVLEGQFIYILSKLFGLYGIMFILLQLALVVYSRIRILKVDAKKQTWLHRNIGLVTLSFIILHVVLFITAVSLRNGSLAYHLLIPNFTGQYYPFMLSLGVIALALLLLSVLFITLSQNKKKRQYRWGHRLTIPALVLLLIHSFTIGSDVQLLAIQVLYAVVCIGSVYYLVILFKNLQKNSKRTI